MERAGKGKIKRVAVTGGAASGKSTVCNYLEQKGLFVIRLDDVAREVVMPGKPAYNRIVSHFGKGVVCGDGNLDRSALRRELTRDPEQKKRLEGWIQPEILKVMNQRIADCEIDGRDSVVVEIPLLFELGMEKSFDLSILVSVEQNIQIRRLMARDKVSEKGALSLINIQMSLEEKRKRADIIVDNNEGPEELELIVDRVFRRYFENADQLSKELDR